MNVNGRRRLLARIIVTLVQRQREHGPIAGEDGGRAVAVMHVAIDHHGPLYLLLTLQLAYCDCNVVDGTEAFAVIRESVMKSAADVEAEALAQGVACGQDGASGRQQ